MRNFLHFWLYIAIVVASTAQPQSTNVLEQCTSAIHDKYRTIGPNGNNYATWHAQTVVYLDSANNLRKCYFTHEHGSNPALVMPGYKPSYGYAAASMNMLENNEGFKSFAFRTVDAQWLITVHQGSGSASNAACKAMHSLDVRAVDNNGVLLADVHIMADFGIARSNEINTPVLQTDCTQPVNTTGTRQFAVVSAIQLYGVGYEPWRPNHPDPFPGFHLRDITFNVLNPMTACADIQCNASVTRIDPGLNVVASGAYRNLTIYNGFGFDATGVFSGTFLFQNTQQYIKPALHLIVPTSIVLYPYDSDAMIYAPLTQGYDSFPFRVLPYIQNPN